MRYRDDREALQARVEALEATLSEKRREVEALRRDARPADRVDRLAEELRISREEVARPTSGQPVSTRGSTMMFCLAAGLGLAFPLAATSLGLQRSRVDPALVAPAAVHKPATTANTLERATRSLNSTTPTTILFVNNSPAPIQTFWVDFSGQEVFYHLVPAGASYVQPTYETHPWRIRAPDTLQLLKEVPPNDSTTGKTVTYT